jgi:hypothetical protein
MVGKNFIYNGVSIPYTTAEGRAAGWYADVLWMTPSVRNLQTQRQDFHGMISKPTFAEGRLISVNGEIFDVNKTNRGTIRNIISDLFVIESFPAEVDEFKKLEFTDDDGTEWFLWAKVYNMPRFEHGRADAIIRFFAQLYAQNPLIFSKIDKSESGIYGVGSWGVLLPTTLPIALSAALNSFTCTSAGNFATPAKITITDDIKNPKVLNLTNGKFFKVNVDMVPGDTLVLDTDAVTATLNGVSVLANRADGSDWLFIEPGNNDFVLLGDDFDIDNQSKAGILIEWNDAKLV